MMRGHLYDHPLASPLEIEELFLEVDSRLKNTNIPLALNTQKSLLLFPAQIKVRNFCKLTNFLTLESGP